MATASLMLPTEVFMASRQQKTFALAPTVELVNFRSGLLSNPHWADKGPQAFDSDKAETLSSDASTCSMPRESSWVLVWCHERCHKSDNGDHRRQLTEICRASGGSLVCLKKASTFAAWLETAGKKNGGQAHLPYVLLSDWREAKPCVDVVATAPPTQQPLLTLLLCEETRIFQRASIWVSSRPSTDGSILVYKDLRDVKARISQSVPQLLEDSSSQKDQARDMSPRSLPEHVAKLPFAAVSAAPVGVVPVVPQAAWPSPVAKPAPWILMALMTWSTSAPDQVEHLLKAAAPEVYMD